MRGLIESIGDSFYTLKKIPLTLATHFYSINLALKGELTNPFFLKDIVDDLKHHTHAQMTLPPKIGPRDMLVFLRY